METTNYDFLAFRIHWNDVVDPDDGASATIQIMCMRKYTSITLDNWEAWKFKASVASLMREVGGYVHHHLGDVIYCIGENYPTYTCKADGTVYPAFDGFAMCPKCGKMAWASAIETERKEIK